MLTQIEAVETAINATIEWARAAAEKAPTRERAAAYGAVEIVARNARSRIKMRLAEAQAHRELSPLHVRNGITNELWDVLLTCRQFGVPEARELRHAIEDARMAGVLT